MHTCKGEKGMETRAGWGEEREIKAMENTHEWGLSLSRRRQWCWNNMQGEDTAAASVKCLQRGDRQYLTAIYMTAHDSHPSAEICNSLCFGCVFITYRDPSAKWLTMLWFGCIWIRFILIMAEIQARKGHKCLRGRIDKVIRQYKVDWYYAKIKLMIQWNIYTHVYW